MQWQRASTVEIADLVRGACRAVRTMAIAGLRDRRPDLRDRDLVPHFAALTLGKELAGRAYPELGVGGPPTGD